MSNNEKKAKLVNKLTEMAETWEEVLEIYDDITIEDDEYADKFAEEYPFNRSFDELLWEFGNWIDNLRKKD